MSLAPPLPAESYRPELLGYCYRYFGCYSEAEDAVQETMIRAWQHAEQFKGRSSLRTWLYRVATNVCLDMKKAPQRRALPVDLQAPGVVPEDPATLATRPREAWVGPLADAWLDDGGDPGHATVDRESVRLAFVAALQLLPPRQRVVLILRDVLSFSAVECADLLDMSVAAVTSALARARRTVADHDPAREATASSGSARDDTAERELLQRYVSAFEAYDVSALVRLLAEDALFSMPPYELWLRGTVDIAAWWNGPGQVCRHSRTLTTRANGGPAMAVYHRVSPGRWEPFALQVVAMREGRITELTHFMGPEVFAEFGLPDVLVDSTRELPASTDQFAPSASSTRVTPPEEDRRKTDERQTGHDPHDHRPPLLFPQRRRRVAEPLPVRLLRRRGGPEDGGDARRRHQHPDR
ncbi:MAG: sigma-70 family RNA polymerase sigma factor [Terracoccus sp.]